MINCYFVSSLERVFLNKSPEMSPPYGKMALDEVYSFQLCINSDAGASDVKIDISSSIAKFVSCRMVQPVICSFPGSYDDYYISNEPFECPEILMNEEEQRFCIRPNQYQSLWFTVSGELSPGKYPIDINIKVWGEEKAHAHYEIEVLDINLGKSRLTYTNWFHYDSISNYYDVPVFSEEYNKIMYNFIKNAVSHGMNTLLIPMFTPPLDTGRGLERLTVQLVDVIIDESGYHVDLSRLIAFMKKAEEIGIEHFEMSHLFTQWGAEFAPKIIAQTRNGEKRIFGWDTRADSDEYKAFLGVFLPQLRKELIDENLYEKCYFHISDEPNETMLDTYSKARKIFTSLMPDAVVMDALSHYEYYEQGLVNNAIASTDAIQSFLDNKVPDLWAYYCCAQGGEYLSNRFMAMPLERTRVIGYQLYFNNIVGFLHWGYNFYNSQFSYCPLNPYIVNDSLGAFPSGDAFIVYPSKNGKALDSVRHEVFYDGIQDFKLMCKLEQKAGRKKAEELLLQNGFEKNFTTYPHSADKLLEIRDMAQNLILQNDNTEN